MSTTIFKTGNKLVSSTIGIGKVVINIPGGAQSLTPVDNSDIAVGRKKDGDVCRPFRIKVYNGHLYYYNGNSYIEDAMPTSVVCTVSTDEEGNTIRLYTLLDGISVGNVSIRLRWSTETTRVEIMDIDNISYAGLFGSSAVRLTEPEMNVEQFEFLPFTRIQAFYATKAYGNIKVLKDKTDLVTLNISGSQVTGDINNLIKSAYTIENISGYQSKIYGELKTLLDAMKAAGVKSRQFFISGGGTGVTYNGNPIGDTTFTFDENGDYTRN